MSGSHFSGRVGIIQRVLASYRKPFFDRLAATPGLSLSVFAGQPLPGEAIPTAGSLDCASLETTTNHYLRPLGELVCWQRNVLSWVHRFRPDVLIVPANPRILSNWLAVIQMRRWERPILGWGLGELERTGPSWMHTPRRMGAASLIRSMDGMIAYGSKAARDYQMAGMSADRIFVAYNVTADDEAERYSALLGQDLSWVQSWKKDHQLDPELPTVLFVGRLIPQKRVDLLIRACAPLFDRCQLLIVGDGPSRPELESLAQKFKPRIRFVGYKSGLDLARCFIASDIFVLPGSGGLAVHQAMSFGKPILASFGDGTERDLVREGENGLFFELNDPDNLCEKLSWLVDNPHKIESMGANSLSIVRHEINLDSMVAVFRGALSCVSRLT